MYDMPIEKDINVSELLNFFEKQLEALKAVKLYKYVLYGGAMGGGKSYFLRWIAVYLLIRWASQGKKNVRVGLFCEDYPALHDRQISKVEMEFPSWLGDLRDGKREFKLKDKYGGGVISFRNLDDPNKYKSAEFAAILVDELTMSLEQVFSTLRTRLRWPGITDVKFIGATNPGGIGHAWVMKRWMLKEFAPEETEKEQFCYIPSTARDNNYLDGSYYRQLEGLPEDMRKAYLEGDWNLFAGQYFAEFRNDKHTIDSFSIPEHWKRYLAIDYGRTNPFAALWFAVNEDGDAFCYREYYIAGIEADDNFEQVKKMSEGEEYEWIVLDSACFATAYGAAFNRGLGESIADIAWRRGLQVQPSPKNRIHGWTLMHMFLNWKVVDENGDATGIKEPRLKFFKTCVNAIRTIPSLVHDKNNVEDLDSKGEDHVADACSYFLQKLHEQKTERQETKPKTYLERMQQMQRIQQNNFSEDFINTI